MEIENSRNGMRVTEKVNVAVTFHIFISGFSVSEDVFQTGGHCVHAGYYRQSPNC
jgi:hypothetical protein